jgi:hypothetical protein
MQSRFVTVVDQVRVVIQAASTAALPLTTVETASELLALAVSYRHSMARYADTDETMDREVDFIASALTQPAPAPPAR